MSFGGHENHHGRANNKWLTLFSTGMQSHYREVPRWEIFYGKGIEIWARFGLVGIAKKNDICAAYEQH